MPELNGNLTTMYKTDTHRVTEYWKINFHGWFLSLISLLVTWGIVENLVWLWLGSFYDKHIDQM